MRNWEDCKRSLFSEDPILGFAKKGYIEGIKRAVNILNIDAKDKKGYTPLMLAAYHGHVEAVKLLLSLTADINSRDNNGNTVLMAATFNGHLEVVEVLLEHGADLHAANFKKQTALVFARIFGMRAIERVLTTLVP